MAVLLWVALLAAPCLAALLPENVTYDIKRAIPIESHMLLMKIAKEHVFQQSILDLITGVIPDNAEEHALMLSGEGSRQITRVSTSIGETDGIVSAVNYVLQHMRSYGFTCVTDTYRADYGPNIICSLVGTQAPSELVILGAHLDDIPRTGRAPGANDDGSGSAALLAIGQAIRARSATFRRSLLLEFYTGEEQGLVGSRALAKARSDRGDNVVAQLQQDMTAVRLAQDPAGVAFVQDSRASSPVLTAHAIAVARTYAVPPFTIYNQVLSGSSCCSDHQSYHEFGFPAVGYIEPRGYTGDPQYHQPGDLVRRTEYDISQLTAAARVALAAAADIAGLN